MIRILPLEYYEYIVKELGWEWSNYLCHYSPSSSSGYKNKLNKMNVSMIEKMNNHKTLPHDLWFTLYNIVKNDNLCDSLVLSTLDKYQPKYIEIEKQYKKPWRDCFLSIHVNQYMGVVFGNHYLSYDLIHLIFKFLFPISFPSASSFLSIQLVSKSFYSSVCQWILQSHFVLSCDLFNPFYWKGFKSFSIAWNQMYGKTEIFSQINNWNQFLVYHLKETDLNQGICQIAQIWSLLPVPDTPWIPTFEFNPICERWICPFFNILFLSMWKKRWVKFSFSQSILKMNNIETIFTKNESWTNQMSCLKNVFVHLNETTIKHFHDGIQILNLDEFNLFQFIQCDAHVCNKEKIQNTIFHLIKYLKKFINLKTLYIRECDSILFATSKTELQKNREIYGPIIQSHLNIQLIFC